MKIGVDVTVCRSGLKSGCKIAVSNYERLHYFNPGDFSGMVCDESSILKNFDGATKDTVTEFMRKLPYRLLCTATAAPNDYIELGTSSEALGYMGFMDMLTKFFKKEQSFCNIKRWRNDSHNSNIMAHEYRFRGHAEHDFWRWVCSWARAMRMPSDFGFENGDFILPELKMNTHFVKARSIPEGRLIDVPAVNLKEQRRDLRRTIGERCEKVAEIVMSHDRSSVAWCHLNDEGSMLEDMIPGSVNVEGSNSDERKEEVFKAFASGELRVIVTKPTIAGFGFNWQHCAHQTFFPSHSYEQYYQAVRRSWRFGQEEEVTVDIVATEGQSRVLSNMERKAKAADRMFSQLVSLMNDELTITEDDKYEKKEIIPLWL
jgi:hypothetical protein